MLFPLALKDAKARYEIPFGSIERNLNGGQEVPSLRWADVSGKAAAGNAAAGCTLLNDCKYGHSLDGATLAVTLIRSSFDPDILPEVGEHAMKFAVCPHGKTPTTAEMVRLGAAFNHPLVVVSTDVHEGDLPSAAAGIASLTPENVILSSIRQSQDGEGLIFHLYETAGKQAAAKVALDKALMGTALEAVEVDFMERPIDPSTAKPTADGFSVTILAHGIAAVKVKLAK
jgi:alpha-mannosidase